MRPALPRYARTTPGELPHAYFLDGACITPISRIAEAGELSPGIHDRGPGEAAIDPSTIATMAKADRVAASIAAELPPGTLGCNPVELGIDPSTVAMIEEVGRVAGLVAAVENGRSRRSPSRLINENVAELAALREARDRSKLLAARHAEMQASASHGGPAAGGLRRDSERCDV